MSFYYKDEQGNYYELPKNMASLVSYYNGSYILTKSQGTLSIAGLYMKDNLMISAVASVSPFQPLIDKSLSMINDVNGQISFVRACAFEGFNSLKTVNLPNCSSIGYSAFAYCSSLTEISLPQFSFISNYAYASSRINIFAGSAFSNCLNLQFINCTWPTLNSEVSYYYEIPGCCFFDCVEMSSSFWQDMFDCLSHCKAGYIAGNAFEGCAITMDTLYLTCSTINWMAFVPRARRYTSGGGTEQFYNFGSIKSLYCPNLERADLHTLPCADYIQLPSKFLSNYSNVLSNYHGSIFNLVGYVDIEAGNPWLCTESGILYNSDKTTLIRYPDFRSSFEIASTVTTIDPYAFNWLPFDSTNAVLSFPAHIKKLAFFNGIPTEFTMSNYANGIIYAHAAQLQDLYLPEELEDFDSARQTNTPYYFMSYFSTLPQIIYNDSYFSNYNSSILSYYRYFKTPANSTYALAATSYLWSGVYFKNLDFIAPACKLIASGTFSGWSAMSTTVKLPSQIEYINGSAFYNVQNFTTLALNSNIKQIGSYAFGYCYSLNTVLYNGTSVPQLLSMDAFEGTNNGSMNIDIYVPYELVQDFKSAYGWSWYSNRIYAITQEQINEYYSD